jgi:hypothetical protein
MDLETRRDVASRKFGCWYLLCSAFTFSARNQDDYETAVASVDTISDEVATILYGGCGKCDAV